MAGQKLATISSLVADWRYAIPDDFANIGNGKVHPALYVAGNGGVFRSLDKGVTWTLFPDDTTDGDTAAGSAAGGYLPNSYVSDLDLSTGNIDPTTGHGDLVAGDPDMLVATTYGRGQFGIRLAPIVFGAGDPSIADTTVLVNGSSITTIAGFSEVSNF